MSAFPAAAQTSVLAQQIEGVNIAQRKLETDRPAVRDLKGRAVGERQRRAALRKKRQQYTGGMTERVAEMKFHRQERRQQRKTDAESSES